VRKKVTVRLSEVSVDLLQDYKENKGISNTDLIEFGLSLAKIALLIRYSKEVRSKVSAVHGIPRFLKQIKQDKTIQVVEKQLVEKRLQKEVL